MKITYYGHSCFGFEINGKKLLFDPFISPNPLAKDIDVESIEADYILISHAHEDHIADAEAIAKRTGAKIISSFEITTHYNKLGIENTHPMNIGGGWDFDFGRVTMTEAVHSSSFPDGSYGGSPAGFVIESKEKTFYYAGDTALFSDMKLIQERFNPVFALLPIGDNFTMDLTDALKAADFLNIQQIIGMHYDTFGFIEIDKEKSLKEAEQAGKDLLLMNIGETKTF